MISKRPSVTEEENMGSPLKRARLQLDDTSSKTRRSLSRLDHNRMNGTRSQNYDIDCTFDDIQSQPCSSSNSNNRQGDVPKTACVGTIKEIELFNFMCHDHFKVTFGPHINFIIGQNGSTYSFEFSL